MKSIASFSSLSYVSLLNEKYILLLTCLSFSRVKKSSMLRLSILLSITTTKNLLTNYKTKNTTFMSSCFENVSFNSNHCCCCCCCLLDY